MKNMIEEFKEFLNRGNLIEIAVGLVMALYFQKIADALLNGVIYPIIATIFGEPDLNSIGFDIGDAFISIGLVLNAVISFVVVAFILFLVVKAYNKVRPPEDDVATGPSEVDLLIEIRDELRAGNNT